MFILCIEAYDRGRKFHNWLIQKTFGRYSKTYWSDQVFLYYTKQKALTGSNDKQTLLRHLQYLSFYKKKCLFVNFFVETDNPVPFKRFPFLQFLKKENPE